MKGKESKRESKKEKSVDGKLKVQSDYQRGKNTKQDSESILKPKK